MTEHPHLAVVEENGIRVVEGRPGQQLMLRTQDIVTDVIDGPPAAVHKVVVAYDPPHVGSRAVQPVA
jgi:hypothetical protein